MNDLTRTSVQTDLGLAGGHAITPAAGPMRSDLVRKTRELQDRTDALMSAGGPETFLQKVGDMIAPSPVRAEKRRGESGSSRTPSCARCRCSPRRTRPPANWRPPG